MRIAVAYEDNEIFQHFGRTPAFLIAEAEGRTLRGTEVVSTAGAGHSALAGFLAERGVSVVICGGIGQGARDGLEGAGIDVVSGQSGSAEAALRFYLNGDLKDNPAGGCGRHGDGGHSCGGRCHGKQAPA